MILGAVLAGGASRRFGSDKALALYQGKPLIDHAIARLAGIADRVVISGGERPGFDAIPDAPAPDLGPLGGLCGAIVHARDNGFAAVLTIPCDTPGLTGECLRALVDATGAAWLRGLPVAGCWPVTLHEMLLDQLAGTDRSMRAWVARCHATPIDAPEVRNINRPDDLATLMIAAEAGPPSD